MSEQLERAIRACMDFAKAKPDFPYEPEGEESRIWYDVNEADIQATIAKLVTLIHEREKQWVEQVGRLKIDLHFAILPKKEQTDQRITKLHALLEESQKKNALLKKRNATHHQQKRELKKLLNEKDARISELETQLEDCQQTLADDKQFDENEPPAY